MCGIAGVISKSSNNINIDILKRMSDVIVHRGPDSDGQWISDNRRCGFTFRRLAIIDLSAEGNQPMHSPDGRYHIVFNGEIYNHREIRKDLEAKGYKYHSQTDTETILYGFMEYGEEIVNKMLGMWGFAIWDSQKNELFAARDRIGVKPFYFYHKEGYFIFGSEIKSILQHPAVSSSLNYDELPNYLNYGMSSNKATLFGNINKLTSGHYLKLNANDELQITRYWTPLKAGYTDMSDEDITTELLRLLRQSIKDRMMSDVPFGVFLSGGIDSSLNVALMSELMDRPVDTFTVGFKELEKYNELEYARKIAGLFKTNHREILIDHNDAFPVLEELVWHEDEPNGDPVCIPLYFLSKLTRDSGTIVVQVGEGSDEQFVGYKWMLRDFNFYNTYWKAFGFIPKPIRSLSLKAAEALIKPKNLFLPLEYIRRGVEKEELYWSGVSVIPPYQQKMLLNEGLQNKINIPAAYAASLHNEALAINPDADYIQRMTYLELKQRIAELLLMRVDKMGMAHSIEARVPFLDHRFVEFTMSIPPDKKLPDKNKTKYLLKKAVEDILPHDIIYRKKMGFAAPVKEWFRNVWYDYAKNEILNSELVKTKVLNSSYILNLLEAHKSGKRNHNTEIYNLLMLSLWHKRFIA